MEFNFYQFHTIETRNADFVDKVDTLLDDYFSPEKLSDSSEYIQVGDYNTKLASKYTNTEDKSTQTNIFSINSEVSLEDIPISFSAYEKMLFSHFFFGKMKTFVISGAMGSGKSTSVNFVIEETLKLPKFKNTLRIKIDFSKGYLSGGQKDVDKLVAIFSENLYDSLRVELVEKISDFKLSNEFLIYIQKEFAEHPKFYELQLESLNSEFASWSKLTEKEKLFKVFKYIENECKDNTEKRLIMAMEFLKFINSYLKQKGVKSIFFYDNIDKLPPVAQRNIFSRILALNEISSVTKVITLRRSSKAKFDKLVSKDSKPIFQNRAQYVYSHIYHHGPGTTKVMLSKYNTLLNNIDKMEMFSILSIEEKENIKNRAKEIIQKFSSHNSLLEQCFSALSGESNRLGLTLANRPFSNYIIPHNESSENLQSLIRSFYIGVNKSNRILPTDAYVVNLFADDDEQFTLINLIILQVIKKAHQENKYFKFCNVVNLYDILIEAFNYSNQEILDSLNYLLSDKRALIGGEYYPEYDNEDELLRTKDNLRITELGDKYYNFLYLKESNYLQNCLLSLKWPISDFSTSRKDTIISRFKAIRECLRFVREEEISRFIHFTYMKKQVLNIDLEIKSIFIHLLKVLSKTFLSVTEQFDSSEILKEEYSEWYNMLLNSNIDNDVFESEISEYETILRTT